MKKFPLLLILVSIILLGGCLVNSQDYDDETIEQANNIVESYFKNNYKNVETIEFIGVEKGQLGGMMVKGEVNGEAEFSVSMDEDSFNIGSIGTNDDFPDRKEECKEQECDF